MFVADFAKRTHDAAESATRVRPILGVLQMSSRRLLSCALLVAIVIWLGRANPLALGPAITPAALAAADVAYQQSFDTLANTATSSTVPAGWGFDETGTNANGIYAAGTGSSNTGDTYSFGATGSPDRALGQLRSGGLISAIGAAFTNTSAVRLTT